MKRIKIEYPIQASFTAKRSESEARVRADRADRIEGRSESMKEKREVKKVAKLKEA